MDVPTDRNIPTNRATRTGIFRNNEPAFPLLHLVSPEDSHQLGRYLGLRYSIFAKTWGQSPRQSTDPGKTVRFIC